MEDIEDVRNWLVDYAEYETDEVCEMSKKELLESWLAAKGAYGITDELIEVIYALYEVEL